MPGLIHGRCIPAMRLYPQLFAEASNSLIPAPLFKVPAAPEPFANPVEQKIAEGMSLVTRAGNIAQLPMHLTYGEDDSDAAAERIALTEQLTKLGSPLSVRYVRGAMHGNEPPELSDPEFYRWLLAQRRHAVPAHFAYVATTLRDNTGYFTRHRRAGLSIIAGSH